MRSKSQSVKSSQSGLPVREVILLTDGDTNRQYHDHDDLIADFAKQHIPVSTIRIGPDLENLRLLQDFAQATGGVFYRVQDIEKLPQLLVGLTPRGAEPRNIRSHSRRSARRARSMLYGISLDEIPPIDFFAETHTKDGAEVPLMIRAPDNSAPLLTIWQYGLGRSAAFVADPDSLGSLAGLDGIATPNSGRNWRTGMRQGDSGLFTMHVHGAPDGVAHGRSGQGRPEPVNNLFAASLARGARVDVAMTEADHRSTAANPRRCRAATTPSR